MIQIVLTVHEEAKLISRKTDKLTDIPSTHETRSWGQKDLLSCLLAGFSTATYLCIRVALNRDTFLG